MQLFRRDDPTIADMTYRGVEIKLVRTGENYRCIPLNSDGRPFGAGVFFVTPFGRIIGSAALNFVLSGGNSSDLSQEDKSARRAEFLISMSTLLTATRKAKVQVSLEQLLPSMFGFVTVTQGELDDAAVFALSILGVPYWFMSILAESGLTAEVDIVGLLDARFSKRYIEIVQGAWGGEADDLANTLGLKLGYAILLKSFGYTLTKKRLQVAESA